MTDAIVARMTRQVVRTDDVESDPGWRFAMPEMVTGTRHEAVVYVAGPAEAGTSPSRAPCRAAPRRAVPRHDEMSAI